MGAPKWKTRLVEGEFPDRSFDIEFWQEQGDEAIFRAAWEMVDLAGEAQRGCASALQKRLRSLNEHEVKYLIVGGYAVMKYTEPRFTKDLDIWVDSSPENCARLFHALAGSGAPLAHDGVTGETFTKPDIVYQIGVAPVRIDILTRITVVEFADAWRNRVASTFFGVPVFLISLDDLVANKRAAGRSPDLDDLERLRNKTGDGETPG